MIGNSLENFSEIERVARVLCVVIREDILMKRRLENAVKNRKFSSLWNKL